MRLPVYTVLVGPCVHESLKLRRLVQMATRQALMADGTRQRLGAVCFRGNSILGVGHNGPHGPVGLVVDTLTAAGFRGDDMLHTSVGHAEVHTVNNAGAASVQGSTILVVRIPANYDPEEPEYRKSHPCRMCTEFMRALKVKAYFYTDGRGNLRKTTLAQRR